MRVLLFCAALLCGLPCFAAATCDVRVPTETLAVGEVRLAYQSIGRAGDPAVLLVMGVGGQLIDWPNSVLTRLCQQGLRVIRFDNRDVGLSSWIGPVPSGNLTLGALRYKLGLPVSAPYHLRDMAMDGLRLMDALQIEHFHLLGASMGGMIAQHMADIAPARIQSLTLLMSSSGALGLPAPRQALLELLARREAPNRAVALEQQADLLAALGSPQIRDDRALLLHQAARSYDRGFNPAGVERQLLAILAESSRVEILKRMQLPVLVIHGTADPLLPVMHGVHLAAQIHGSQLVLVPGMAHRFQENFKAPLLAAVLPYIATHQLPVPGPQLALLPSQRAEYLR
jgi:pimeloyl-ACP methyl ester carboxylesterase